MQQEYPLLDIEVTILEIDELDDTLQWKICLLHWEKQAEISAKDESIADN